MSWRLFKFHKLEISVHPYFLLLIFLWILSGLPFQTLFLFILVLGHELTHTIVAKMCGLEVSKVELFPFGGVGYLTKPLEFNPRKEIIVAGVGPLFNLIVFLFLWNYRNGLYGLPIYPDPSIVTFLIRANMFLFFFNLLPGLPLDGGRVARALLTFRLGFFRATEAAISAGKCLGVLLFLIGLLLSYFDYFNLSLSLIGIFLYSAAGRDQQTAIYTFLRYLLRKEKALKKNKVLKGEQLVALESTTILEVLKYFKPSKYHQVLVLNQTCRVMDLLSESQLLETAMNKGMDIPLRRLVRK